MHSFGRLGVFCSRRKPSIDFKEIIIHMLCSVRYFPFHCKQGAATFHYTRIQIKQRNKSKHESCLPNN